MVDLRAAELLDRAAADPAQVLSEAKELLEELDPDSRAVVFRAMSIAARNAATIEESIEFARMGCAAASSDGIRRECLMTLAGSISETGDVVSALQVLDEASDGAEGLLAAQLQYQRGTIQAEGGDYDAAIESFTQAFPAFEESDSADYASATLHNLGYVYTQVGRLDEAEGALHEARRLEESLGARLEVSGTDNNLGVLAAYRGDIPEALRRLALSDETEMKISGTDVPRHVTRCEVLISAGLFHDALDLAKRIASGAKASGRGEDHADAVLVAARAALLADDPGESIDLAQSASELFEQQGRNLGSVQAGLVEIEARYLAGGASRDLLQTALEVAENLGNSKLVVGEIRARILTARIAIDLGDTSTATEQLNLVGQTQRGPIEVRVQQWLARALVRLVNGDKRGADSAARAGLNLLDEYQSGLGASDLRSGIERLGTEMGDIGLRLAVESRNPRRVFRWMERTRGRALRFPPVTPAPDDPEQPLLAELRRVSAEMRTGDNQLNRQLARRRRQLQEQLRRSNQRRRRDESVVAEFAIASLVETLGGRTLIELALIGDRLHAVEVRDGKFRIKDLGGAADLQRDLGRLRFDLRRTARLGRSPDSVRRAVESFGARVLGKISMASDEVVIVPPGPLMAVPWSALPGLAGRTVTVAPSAEIWWRARLTEERSGGVVLAAGPDLDQAEPEVRKLRSLHPDGIVLGPTTESDAFGSWIAGARLAHVACHASFEVDNPMFSSLRLGDGDFNVYDIERLGQSPDLMVLSACDSGYTETRAGDELTGLTSALLSMGSRSVVASVGLVPDTEATTELMVRFHSGLTKGSSPAEALSRAQGSMLDDPDGYIAAASFLCIGGG